MRVLLTGNHVYPIASARGVGRRVKPWPSGSGQRLQDLTARGLAEEGHEVVYYLTRPAIAPAPRGVTIVDRWPADVDVMHTLLLPEEFEEEARERGVPHIAVLHLHPGSRGLPPPQPREEWVYVSRWLAESLGGTRVVRNGVDPAEYVYSETKGDYALFMSSMDWCIGKGLDVAIALSKKIGFRLVVAGTARSEEALAAAMAMCEAGGAEFVGDVQGSEKADLLAGARALLHPSRYQEACPLTIMEALVSGTPVITTPWGASSELMTPEVGFLCETETDYAEAFARLGAIRPRACRDYALSEFHYRRMVAEYVREYETALGAFTTALSHPSTE
ncbi:MAG TPA: glycosyltransferase [Thermoanaerobaculia bacterium]|nr:glycosyltransferase [Thermoanaerobaculia bacterium]